MATSLTRVDDGISRDIIFSDHPKTSEQKKNFGLPISKIMETTKESIIAAVKGYFDDDIYFKITLESLATWLATRSIQVDSAYLEAVLSECPETFEITEGPNGAALISLKKVDPPKIIVLPLMPAQRITFLEREIKSTNGKESQTGDSYLDEYTNSNMEHSIKGGGSLKSTEEKQPLPSSQISRPETQQISLSQTGTSGVSTTSKILKEENTTFSSIKNESIDVPKETLYKYISVGNSDSKAVTCARQYLEKNGVDSVHELEQHLKEKGFSVITSPIMDFLHVNSHIFQVSLERGVTCVRLVQKTSTTTTNGTMLKNRMNQTEILVKNYLSKNNDSGSRGVAINELIVLLREQPGTITHQLVDFLMNCPDLFECKEYEDVHYVSLLPSQKLISPKTITNPFGKYRMTKPYTVQLIRDCVCKLGIATLNELETLLNQQQYNITKEKIDEYLNGDKTDFETTHIEETVYIRLKKCDNNLIHCIRKYMMEFGKARLLQLQDYLKKLDMLPSSASLKEFLNPWTEFKITSESGVYWIRSPDIEIVRSCRAYLRNKSQIRMSVLGDYLKRTGIAPRIKLADLLETYTDFLLYQCVTDVFVEYKPFPGDQPPMEYIKKYIALEGSATLAALAVHLNWSGKYPEFKILELLQQSKEFDLKNTEGKPGDTLVTFKNQVGIKGPQKIHPFVDEIRSKSEITSKAIYEPFLNEGESIDFIDASGKLIPQTKPTADKPNSQLINSKESHPKIEAELNWTIPTLPIRRATTPPLNSLVTSQIKDVMNQDQDIKTREVFIEQQRATIGIQHSKEVRIPWLEANNEPQPDSLMKEIQPKAASKQFHELSTQAPVLKPQAVHVISKLQPSQSPPKPQPIRITSQVQSDSTSAQEQKPTLTTSPGPNSAAAKSQLIQLPSPTTPPPQAQPILDLDLISFNPMSEESQSTLFFNHPVTAAERTFLEFCSLVRQTSKAQYQNFSKSGSSENSENINKDVRKVLQKILVKMAENDIDDGPLFGQVTLDANPELFQNYTSLGTLESSGDYAVYLNYDLPFSIIIIGLPSSGIVKMKQVILEGCLIQNSRISKLISRLSALILRYERSSLTLPCMSAYLGASTQYVGKFKQPVSAEKVIVLVSPSNYRNMKKVYDSIEACEVRPLLFSETDLSVDYVKAWLDIKGDFEDRDQIMELADDLFYAMQDDFNYSKFCSRLLQSTVSFRVKGFLKSHLSRLDSFITERLKQSLKQKGISEEDSHISMSLGDLFQPGVAVIVDLSDPVLHPEMASVLFDIVLGIYTRTSPQQSTSLAKLVMLDEADKFLRSQSSLTNTLQHLQSNLYRRNIRLVVTTHNPILLPPTVLYQSNLHILHQFSSPTWAKFLTDHIDFENSDPKQLLKKAMRLKFGQQALIFCSNSARQFSDQSYSNSEEGGLDESKRLGELDNGPNGVIIMRKVITLGEYTFPQSEEDDKEAY
ncbi:hypothetical protein G9A89_004248 [Geosiphon pyriformis]|nr:hypothetical protein G9A89_004248 [Geosiphon pyriformis]